MQKICMFPVFLKFKVNWASHILSGNPAQGQSESASAVETEALNTTPGPPREGDVLSMGNRTYLMNPKQLNRENKRAQQVTLKKALLSWVGLFSCWATLWGPGSHWHTGLCRSFSLRTTPERCGPSSKYM